MVDSSPPPLSDAQREIMEIVWDRGEVTVADVWEALEERRGVARNTVQTLMARLEEKGWIEHRTVGRTFVYSAVLSRDASRGRSLRTLLETLFQGSTTDLVTALLEDRSLSADEADRIRAMIDDAERRRKKQRRR